MDWNRVWPPTMNGAGALLLAKKKEENAGPKVCYGDAFVNPAISCGRGGHIRMQAECDVRSGVRLCTRPAHYLDLQYAAAGSSVRHSQLERLALRERQDVRAEGATREAAERSDPPGSKGSVVMHA